VAFSAKQLIGERYGAEQGNAHECFRSGITQFRSNIKIAHRKKIKARITKEKRKQVQAKTWKDQEKNISQNMLHQWTISTGHSGSH
jgi:hypothetical protein